MFGIENDSSNNKKLRQDEILNGIKAEQNNASTFNMPFENNIKVIFNTMPYICT